MEFIKKYCNVRANSILESVVALCIISACLYIAIMVYANIFNSGSSTTFYHSRNKTDELYFLSQVRPDSLFDALDSDYEIEEEWLNPRLRKVNIIKNDTMHPMRQEYFLQQ